MTYRTTPHFGFAAILVLLMLFGGVLLLTGCPGPPRLTLTHDGLVRTYVLRVPPGHDPATPTPLVVVLHGGLGNAESAANTFPFEHLADEAGWLVAYPESIGNQWNDGRLDDDTDTGANRVDDVGFLEALIDALIESHGADPERVFMAGASNGGMMTYRFACERADRLAGMAPVIAGVPVFVAESCGAAGPVPAVIFNGTDDPVVPFLGGPVGFSDRGLGAVISAPDSAALMAARNGCDAIPLEEAFEDIADDDTSIRRWTYTDCGAAPVVFYIIEGGGHNVPGDNRGAPEFLVGPYSEELDIPDTAWAFFLDLAG
jgi:polyhydroxybutyrate depolymerase